jgi:hypothetical protein
MDFGSGNIFIRKPISGRLRKDQVILGHSHEFDHTTVVFAGSLKISLLDVLTYTADGLPLEAVTALEIVISQTDDNPWFLIMKGRHHILQALEEGTNYGCFYSHREPQATSPGMPGTLPQKPYSKTDEDGTLWVRCDPTVVQDSMGWLEAYR